LKWSDMTVAGGLCGLLRCSCFRTGHQRWAGSNPVWGEKHGEKHIGMPKVTPRVW